MLNAHAHAKTCVHSHTRAGAHTHTEKYVTLIAFPQQQWFREGASMLRDTYIACLVLSSLVQKRTLFPSRSIRNISSL
jgi:hypothetical protein